MVKNPPANAGDVRDAGSIPGSGRSPGGGHGNPLQHSCLENPTWGRTESDMTYVTQHARKKRDSSVYELDYEILVSYLPALYLICFQL